jgi:CDP-glucose 4,6-dehydratase
MEYSGKKILVTGHTGFKGSWLCMMLNLLGAKISGIALEPPTNPSLYEVAQINRILVNDFRCEIGNRDCLSKLIYKCEPEIIFHLAAQPLVIDSYRNPIETFTTNVIGTANLLEVIRKVDSVEKVVIVTTDKCYRNNENFKPFVEDDPLGGRDPYSSSKAATELVVDCWRSSFFNEKNSPIISSARAGNVIGGGDWSENRIVPDIVKATINNNTLYVRNPDSVRPWQHVLEPLNGYILLAQSEYSGAVNFGPDISDCVTVSELINLIKATWYSKLNIVFTTHNQNLHEAKFLSLDSSKAKIKLGWKPRWNLMEATKKISEWYDVLRHSGNMITESENQILSFWQNSTKVAI